MELNTQFKEIQDKIKKGELSSDVVKELEKASLIGEYINFVQTIYANDLRLQTKEEWEKSGYVNGLRVNKLKDNGDRSLALIEDKFSPFMLKVGRPAKCHIPQKKDIGSEESPDRYFDSNVFAEYENVKNYVISRIKGKIKCKPVLRGGQKSGYTGLYGFLFKFCPWMTKNCSFSKLGQKDMSKIDKKFKKEVEGYSLNMPSRMSTSDKFLSLVDTISLNAMQVAFNTETNIDVDKSVIISLKKEKNNRDIVVYATQILTDMKLVRALSDKIADEKLVAKMERALSLILVKAINTLEGVGYNHANSYLKLIQGKADFAAEKICKHLELDYESSKEKEIKPYISENAKIFTENKGADPKREEGYGKGDRGEGRSEGKQIKQQLTFTKEEFFEKSIKKIEEKLIDKADNTVHTKNEKVSEQMKEKYYLFKREGIPTLIQKENLVIISKIEEIFADNNIITFKNINEKEKAFTYVGSSLTNKQILTLINEWQNLDNEKEHE